MEIERKVIPRLPKTIEEFADLHCLTMVVTECDYREFHAAFKGAEVQQGNIGLLSAYGRGHSEESAIDDYARRISGQSLIIDAYLDSRREIRVPNFVR